MQVKSFIKGRSVWKKNGEGRGVREERKQRKELREPSGGGGIECSVSPVLDCFSLIALH